MPWAGRLFGPQESWRPTRVSSQPRVHVKQISEGDNAYPSYNKSMTIIMVLRLPFTLGHDWPPHCKNRSVLIPTHTLKLFWCVLLYWDKSVCLTHFCFYSAYTGNARMADVSGNLAKNFDAM